MAAKRDATDVTVSGADARAEVDKPTPITDWLVKRVLVWVVYGGAVVITWFVTVTAIHNGTITAQPWEPPTLREALLAAALIVAFFGAAHLVMYLRRRTSR